MEGRTGQQLDDVLRDENDVEAGHPSLVDACECVSE